ncbi:MAG: hypothetical protein V4719_02855 [Planctomycetota bacterium]
MKYPHVKPPQGEQQDVNQRQYPADNIELAGPQTPPQPGKFTPVGTPTTPADPQPRNRPPARQ